MFYGAVTTSCILINTRGFSHSRFIGAQEPYKVLFGTKHFGVHLWSALQLNMLWHLCLCCADCEIFFFCRVGHIYATQQ